MASFFAAHVAFSEPVLGQTTAFVGVMAVGILGIAVAVFTNLVALAVIALLGLYLSPAILGSHQDSTPSFMAYLGAITCVGLGVAYFRRRWHGVRLLTLIATWLWLLVWVAQHALVVAHRDLGMAAFAVMFALTLAEAVASLHRGMRKPPEDEGGYLRKESPNAEALEYQLSIASFLNTAVAFGGFATILTQTNTPGLWIAALALAGVLGLLLFATPSEKFSVAVGLQAAALVTIAAPLYFNASAITLAWGVMSAALGVYAFTSQSRAARWWSFILMLLVALRLFSFDMLDEHFQEPWACWAAWH